MCPPPLGEGAQLFALETLLPLGGLPDGLLDEYHRPGLGMPAGWAIDARGSRIPLVRWASSSRGLQRIYSAVPSAWLDAAAYPVVIDPDLDVVPVADAMIEGASAATSSSVDNGGATLNVGAMTFGGAPHLWRGYLKFNTASLGPTAQVQQVNLRMYPSVLLATLAWTIYVRQYNWAAHDPLSTGSREAAWDGLLATANTAVLATSTNPAGTFVTSANLGTAWVSLTGNTYYGLWCNQEAGSFSNGQGAYHQYASADNATPANRPLLMVDYLAGYPLSGPLPLRVQLPQPRVGLADTRLVLRARARRTALHTRFKRG